MIGPVAPRAALPGVACAKVADVPGESWPVPRVDGAEYLRDKVRRLARQCLGEVGIG